ncbi:hypothetical protein O6R05_04730 [Peptoniphilus equinus]|uniref:Mobile element protein CD1107-like domain-containing protein n=1 Tax=Peptoniphilus equinus TaxID=3016343 RepID=A0ABY7QTV5_9FIRM|nr:hypothetical protein [Peptoniphilus equinus]WBW49318.1 hypothetical protein O6R05_04730 [Peptoniphilus equinus]
MKHTKKCLINLVLALIILTPRFVHAQDNIINKIKVDDNTERNQRVVELLKPEKNAKDTPEPKTTPEKVTSKKAPTKKVTTQTPTVKKETVTEPSQPISEAQSPITLPTTPSPNESSNIAKEEKQYITFTANNGRLYYLVINRSANGETTTNLYSEMSDERIQSLSKDNTDAEKEKASLEAQKKQLDAQKKQLEALKNKDLQDKKGSSNIGTYIFIFIVVAGVIGFKKFKDQKQNQEAYEEDDDGYDEADDIEDGDDEIIEDEENHEVYDDFDDTEIDLTRLEADSEFLMDSDEEGNDYE